MTFPQNGKRLCRDLGSFRNVPITQGCVDEMIVVIGKYKAKKGKWRIPEAVLLCVGLLGGSLGALLGMYLFRHKTKHWYFWLFNWLGFVILIVGLWYFARGFGAA